MPRGSRRKDVEAALHGAFASEGWHGPTVLEALRGLRRGDADAKPAGAHHSIHELVRHIEHWEAVGADLVRSPGLNPEGGGDWKAPPRAFGASVRRMRATHARLVRAVARLGDADLDRPTKSDAGSRPLAEVLHAIAAHAAYHAGQIRMLRALLVGRPGARPRRRS